MKFKIDAIDGAQTTVTFSFDDGSTSTQNIANLPVDDEQALTQVLADYGVAYLAGKEIEKANALVPAAGLVGKTLTPPTDNVGVE